MTDLVLEPALDSIILMLSEKQQRVLADSARAGSDDGRVPVVGPEATVGVLVERFLAWEPGYTAHRAELTPLGLRVARRLEEVDGGGERTGRAQARAVARGGSVDESRAA